MNDESWRSLYPFRSRWLQVKGGRYHYLDEGAPSTPVDRNGAEPADARPTLLMVHGNPTWSFYWRRLIQAFAPEYRVVVPDHLGCGLSDKPTDYAYSLQSHIDNLVTLVDTLSLRQVTMLGHDWGGAIGLGAALARPDRFERFVLFNTAAFPPPFIPWRIRVCRTPLLGRLALQGFNLFSRAALSMAVERPSSLPPAVRAGLLAPYDCWSHRVGVYRFVKDIPARPTHPTWDTLARIEAGLDQLAQQPIQLIWGMRDWCFRPACLDRLVEHWPHARVLKLPTAGHWVVEEAHDEIVACLREFLACTATAK